VLRTLAQISPADAAVGGKAQGLARLFGAGLPVPDAVVIPSSAYRGALSALGGLPASPTPADLESLASRLRAIPLDAELCAELSTSNVAAPFAVRSSASCEDQAVALAPGVFLSCRKVPPAELEGAIREVWASLLSPTAQAYLATRGVELSSASMAVIVQHDAGTPSCLSGTAYTRDPGDAQAPRILLEIAQPGRSPALVVLDRPSLRVVVASPLLGDDAAIAIARAALACEAELGRPADVEWVLGPRLWLVQARPLLFSSAPRSSFPDDALDFSRQHPDVLWTWDAVHNPDPLSPAQEGLVTWMNDEGAAPFGQRVVEGYLYTSAQGPPFRTLLPEALEGVFEHELRPAMESALLPLSSEAPDLETALFAYLAFYRLYSGVLSPAISRAKRRLLEFLQERLDPRVAEAAAAELLGGAAGDLLAQVLDLRTVADVTTAWDVASPSWPVEKTPRKRVPPALPDRAGRLGLTAADHGALADLLPMAREAARLGELDDLWFQRAQAGVRRALVAQAQRFHLSVAEITHLPLTDVRAAARSGALPENARARAARAQADRQRRRRLTPPFVIIAGAQVFSPPKAVSDSALVGRGVGGRARGHVVLVHPDAPAPKPGAVLVTTTVIPAMAPLLAEAAAVVAEQGGLLGHGAALARELGIPCVVGATGAQRCLRDGDEVLVDGALGLVLRLSNRPPPPGSAPTLDPWDATR
jgi:pyruvate,water dikinase